MDLKNKQYFHLATLLNLLVGVVYFLFRYFITVQTDFGEMPSEYQPYFQYFHILFVVPWVFVFGMLFQTHMLPKLKKKLPKKKKSGITLMVLSVLMILSGYTIQVSSPEWMGLSHVIISGAWFCVYLWHILRD